MNIWLEVTKSDHRVVNRIVWDGVTPYEPPSSLYLVPSDEHPGLDMGWAKIDGVWTAPERPQEIEPEVPTE